MAYEGYKKTDKVTSDGYELWFNKAAKSICIKKDLVYYDKTIFERLRENRNEHVPRIYDFYHEDGKLVVFEQFIRGITLSKFISRRHPDNKELKRIIGEVIDGLEFLHGPGMRIIHREIKPDHIKLDTNGNVYIVGYNSAKLYKPGAKTNADIIAVGKLIRDLLPDDESLIGVAGTAIGGGYQNIGELRRAFGGKKKRRSKGWLMPVFAALFAVAVFGFVMYLFKIQDQDVDKQRTAVDLSFNKMVTMTPTPTPAPTAPPTAPPTQTPDLTAQELNDGNGRMYSYRGLVEDVMEVTGISEREAMKAVNDLHLDFKEQADSFAHAYMTYYMETYPIDVRNALEDVGFTKLEIDYVMTTTSLESSAQILGKARDYLYKLASEKAYKRTSDYKQAMRDMGFGNAFIKEAFLSSGGFEIKSLIKKGKVINDDKTVLPKSDSDEEENN